MRGCGILAIYHPHALLFKYSIGTFLSNWCTELMNKLKSRPMFPPEGLLRWRNIKTRKDKTEFNWVRPISLHYIDQCFLFFSEQHYISPFSMKQTKTNLTLQDWVCDFVVGRARAQWSIIVLAEVAHERSFNHPVQISAYSSACACTCCYSLRVISQVIDKYRAATGRYFLTQEHKTCRLHFKLALKSPSEEKLMS